MTIAISPNEGVIIPDRLYTFEAFQRTTGVGRAGLSEAKKQGLEVRYFGRKGYVLGADIIAFIKTNGKTSR